MHSSHKVKGNLLGIAPLNCLSDVEGFVWLQLQQARLASRGSVAPAEQTLMQAGSYELCRYAGIKVQTETDIPLVRRLDFLTEEGT